MRSVRKIGLSEFKAKLSKYLRMVKAGDRVILEERGHPVAELNACRDDRQDVARAAVARGPNEPGGMKGVRLHGIPGLGAIDVVALLREERDRR